MGKILFDLISTQGGVNGGAEYTLRILHELMRHKDADVICLYDSNLDEDDSIKRSVPYTCLDINTFNSISEIIDKVGISLFFIGIAQRYAKYDLTGISCRCVVVMHDVGDLENTYNRLYVNYPHASIKTKHLLREVSRFIRNTNHPLSQYQNTIAKYAGLVRFMASDNVRIVTVSEHSRDSIMFFFAKDLIGKEIAVLYPPMKRFSRENRIENQTLKEIIADKNRYFLIISAHRADKNANVVFKAFERFVQDCPQYFLLAVGGTAKNINNVINLPLLSSSDLEHAYQNAYAFIYPSLQEGFGYPPLEAMKHSVPSIISNVCSMPDIYTGCLFFSPFYANDLYRKMHMMHKDRNRYISGLNMISDHISDRQNNDLKQMLELILCENE